MIAIIRRRAPCSIQSIRSNTIQSRLKRKHGYSSIQEKSTKQTLQAAFTTKLSIFNSIGNPSFESQYEIATKRHFSSISNRIWEMVQSGSVDPSNPIIDDIVSQKDGNTLNDRLFRFSNYQPHHFFDAAEELQEKYESALTQLESEIVLSSQSKEEKNYNVQLFESCREVLRTLEEMSLPMIMFQNIVVINASLKNNNNDDAMINALSDASNIIQFKHESSKVIYDALLPFENVVCDSDKRETSRAILRLLQKLRTNGAMINDEETLSILKELNERILTSESKLVTLSSYTMEQHGKVTPTQKLLPFLYEIIALKQHRSKLLGYDNYASYSLDAHSCMVKDMDQLEQFHESFVEAGAVDKFANDDFMSQHYDIMNDDSLNPEFLEDYFELNRVLEKLFNLCSKLFGIVIEEEQDKSKVLAWDNDVRLFHVYENDTGNDDDGRRHIASFYIDAFNRLSKPVGEFMAPIVYKSNATPISSVAVSLSIRPPIWDESPTKMHVYDVVHLFHEFGHVLQNLLSTVELGAFSGAQVIEEDASEFVSQVSSTFSRKKHESIMSYLTEVNTVYGVLVVSDTASRRYFSTL
jgi:hypothetical protein